MENISTIVVILVSLSIASERLVEIVKNGIPGLAEQRKDPMKENWRKAFLQGLAVISGIVTALLARAAIGEALGAPFDTKAGIIALGFLASGGSGFWNSVANYLLKVKDIRKEEARQMALRTSAEQDAIAARN